MENDSKKVYNNYINLQTAKEIAEGWTNKLLKRQQELSEERMKICNTCKHISTKHNTYRLDVHCTKCGCTLDAKTRSEKSECPIGLWKAVNITENGKLH